MYIILKNQINQQQATTRIWFSEYKKKIIFLYFS